jgi:hypothetical protein
MTFSRIAFATQPIRCSQDDCLQTADERSDQHDNNERHSIADCHACGTVSEGIRQVTLLRAGCVLNENPVLRPGPARKMTTGRKSQQR